MRETNQLDCRNDIFENHNVFSVTPSLLRSNEKSDSDNKFYVSMCKSGCH